MSNKNVNLVAGIILPVVVIITTVALFFLFCPEETEALFYINLGYTVFLEIVFFSYLNAVYRKINDFSTPFIALFGIFALCFVLASAGWMLVFSLILIHFIQLKFYIAGIIVLTLLWIILSVLLAQSDSNYKTATDKLKSQQHTLEYYTQKITLFASRYEKLCAEKGVKYETGSNNSTVLDRLKNKISFLTPNILRSETAVAQLYSLLDKCETFIEQAEDATEEAFAEISKKMQHFVDNAVAELDLLKNMTRK